MSRQFQITVDCLDADRMARFWATALGYRLETPPPGYLSWQDFLRANQIPVPETGSISAIVDPDGGGPRLLFLRGSEHRPLVHRFSFDLRAGGGDDAKLALVERLEEAGATMLRRVDGYGDWWVVMSDPEGNEFCVT